MRILLISGTGLLGSVLARSFEAAGIPFFATTRRELNLELPVRPQIEPILRNGEFTHVILCAAMADLGECFRDPQRSLRVNLLGPIELWEALLSSGCKPIFISSDMAFDCHRDFRREDEEPCPTTVYGHQKVECERALRELHPGALIFRPSKIMSFTFHPRNVLAPLVEAARGRALYRAFKDQYITPVFAEDMARAIVQAMRQELEGVFHLAGPERVSRTELAELVCKAWSSSGEKIEAVSFRDVPAREPRGPFHTLCSKKIVAALNFQFTSLEAGIKEMKSRLVSH